MTRCSDDNAAARTPPKQKGKDLCIWVVSPFGGKVKKLRLKVWLLSCVGFAACVTTAGVGLMTRDYVRLQILRARNYLYLQSLSAERDTLKNSNHTLQSQLQQMKSKQGRLETYEQGVRQRLSELQSVVAAVQAMGIDPAAEPRGNETAKTAAAISSAKSKHAASTGGIGGAEIECKPGDIRCSGLLLDADEVDVKPPGFGTLIMNSLGAPLRFLERQGKRLIAPDMAMQDEIQREATLLTQLDQYITVFKVLPFGLPGIAGISSGFGYRHSPFTSRVALHEGLDFAMPAGSDVVSTGDGIVKEVRFTPTYGLVIDIEHTPQVSTRYAHLRKALVREGETVHRGDVIGLVGSTGRSTGPHLHYEVRIDGEAKNPEDMIALGERLATTF